MDNLYVVTLLYWPAVVLVCAGLNMLISWTFSWSELIFDYLAGLLAGYFLFSGVQPDAHGAEIFFFVFSHGLLAWLWAGSEGFRAGFSDPATFFLALGGIRVGATLWAAAWDHVSASLGAELSWSRAAFSLLVAPAKIPFSLLTSGVGLLIWLAGVVSAVFGSGRAGFAGGMFFAEFVPDSGGYHATTLGCTVMTWYGKTPFKHELYHSRQHIYLADWLVPFWCLGILWGLASAAISKDHEVGAELAFGADENAEVGNPLEVAPHHLA